MIGLKKVSKKFDNLVLFDDFNISFNEHKITSILGPSGCGKTTLVNILSGLSKPDKGTVFGTENQVFSYIFQEPRLINWLSVYENVEFVLKDIIKNKNELKNEVESYLQMMGLLEYKDYMPDALSGGMAQRVSIARGFAFRLNILIMDEPFKGLNLKLKKELMRSFMKLWKEHLKTSIFITHDFDEALELSHYIYVVKNQPLEIVKQYDVTPNNKNKIRNELIYMV